MSPVTKQNRIFLGKKGRSYGPYTPSELEALRASGELKDYFWIWDLDEKKWIPLDPPPPPIPEEALEKNATPRKGHPLRHDTLLDLEAICHNAKTAVSGSLRRVSEQGCEMVIRSSSHATTPPFAKNAKLFLNLLDPESGKTEDLSAVLLGVSRKENQWIYQIQWRECPELVSSKL